MSTALLRQPGYYGRPRYERQAWQQFGKLKFPNYDHFWQTFVPPRIRPTAPYIKFLDNVSPEERLIIRLHQRIFAGFSSLYSYKPHTGYLADWQEQAEFMRSLNKLSAICDNTERLLLMLQAVYRPSPVAGQYVQRLYDRQAKIRAAYAPGRRYSLLDMPKRPPAVAIAPDELKMLHQAYNLGTYDTLASQIRAYQKTVSSLSSFNIKRFLPSHDPIQPITVADAAALQRLLGDYRSMRQLVVDRTDQLLAVLNGLYSQQLLPLLAKPPDQS